MTNEEFFEMLREKMLKRHEMEVECWQQASNVEIANLHRKSSEDWLEARNRLTQLFNDGDLDEFLD